MTKTAKPETGTIVQVAVCSGCGEVIEKSPTSNGWYHAYTGTPDC